MTLNSEPVLKKLLTTILLILNAVALLLMLASTMAGIVPPSKLIAFSFLSYGYTYLLLFNVAFVIIWLLLSSKWFLLSLVGILLRMSFIPLFFQVGGTDKVETEDSRPMLKVLTFNAHRFRGTELVKWSVDDSNMLEFIRIVEDEQPDVIALQEYVGRGDTVHLTDRLSSMGYVNKFSGLENGSMTGNVIFSKLPILARERVGESSKICADLLWNGDTVRFYSLHLDSYRLDENDQKQIHDLSHGNMDSTTGRATLRKFRETLLTHEKEWLMLKDYFLDRDKLTVVAGDFNDTPASFLYQQCRKLFKDSYCEAGQGFSTTYHGDFAHNVALPVFRIDMILHSSDMQALAYRRIKSQISDHYPIVVTLVNSDQ